MVGSLRTKPGLRRATTGQQLMCYHREDRIHAHIRLCWLALLLSASPRPPPATPGANLRHELDRLHLVILATPDGRVAQRSALTPGHKTILGALRLLEPPGY
ncbi:MAG: hypothetical protein ACRDSZ_23895 [Pseudonocardiaceae bacterium]